MIENTMSLEDRAELSMSDYRAASEKGFVAPEVQATDDKPTEPVKDPEPKPETETETEQELPKEAVNGQPEDESIVSPDDPRGVKKRLGKVLEREQAANARLRELEAENAELRAKRAGSPEPETPAPVASDKPRLEQYDSVEEFTDALTDWKADQREKQAAAKAYSQKIAEQIKSATEKYPDFQAVANSKQVALVLQTAPHLGSAILESPIFADLAMHLGQDLTEFQRLAAMPMARALVELGKIELKLSTATAPKQEAPALPQPIKPVGGRSATKSEPSMEDKAEMPYMTWKRLRQAETKA